MRKIVNETDTQRPHYAGALTKPVLLVISEASLSALKWIAVVLMVVDHINKFLLGDSQPWMYALGRMAMPLFAAVLGCNLARANSLQSGAYQRMSIRLFLCALLAWIPHAALNKSLLWFWPMNILFTLLLATISAWMLDAGGRWRLVGVISLLLWGGLMVEFWWPAVGLVLFVWAYCRKPNIGFLIGWLACLGALYFINGNHWALAVIPVLWGLSFWRWELPRMRWFFYAFYPFHLWVIWGVVSL